MRLRVSIGKRLFLAMLLSIMAVAAIGVALVRWKLSDQVSLHAVQGDMGRLGGLVDALSTQYREHRGWSFLPASPEQRKRWLRDELVRLQVARPGTTLLSPSLPYRVGLLDANLHGLAGAIANRAMVAVASIDRVRRPIVIDGRVAGYLVVAQSQNPEDELAIAFLVEQQRNLAILGAFGLLLSVLAAGVLAAHFRRPVKQLVEGARRLGRGQFEARLPVRRSDELGELAATFNQVAARLENTERWRQQWVADTSHELRTPLSVLRAQLEALQDGVRTGTPETVALMLRQVTSLTALVDDLHELARADQGQLHYDKTTVDAWPLVTEVFGSFGEKFRAARLAASLATALPPSMVHADADRLRQVLVNLLENSVRYTDAGGRVDVGGGLLDGELHITIDDSAPAVPAALIERLGERFFRVEPSRNRQLGGAGLGLALSRHLIDAHGGRLEFAASALGGLRATVVLPLESP